MLPGCRAPFSSPRHTTVAAQTASVPGRPVPAQAGAVLYPSAPLPVIAGLRRLTHRYYRPAALPATGDLFAPRVNRPGCKCLDWHIPCGVYKKSGICLRHHRGAEPPRDIEPTGLVRTVGWRDRASASYAAADGVKAPARAPRGRFRGIHGGRTAPCLPVET